MAAAGPHPAARTSPPTTTHPSPSTTLDAGSGACPVTGAGPYTALPDPFDAPAPHGACPFDPPPAYQQARRERPVARTTLWDGSSCWMITRHEDVRRTLRDDRFSAEAHRPGFPFQNPGRRALATGRPTFIRMDDPDHARLRRMLTADFMIRKVESLRPQVQELADELLDSMTKGRHEADFVSDFALPLPSVVICLLLGVPYSEHAFFQRCSSTMLRADATEAEVTTAQDELLGYLAELTRTKRHSPDDGILSRLAEQGELSDDEIARMGRLLLVAGHETTANMTSLSTLAMLRNPRELERMRAAGPDEVKSAVEELLRYLTVIQGGVTRVATEDVAIGDTVIRAGEGVLCMISAANRDEDVFADADRLDLARPGSRRHIAFGFGVHQCLGQPLARLELQVALPTVLRRLPDLRLAIPFEDVRFRHDMLVYGVHSLPVAW
ncbi:cytochrome P450 [Streptomyces sp. NBC_00448]|uniref:cytochrome P450 n=1 Tax=Streptomyces sp. NBC_00448 TaxID=2903652 RepID=UPI002E1C4DAA